MDFEWAELLFLLLNKQFVLTGRLQFGYSVLPEELNLDDHLEAGNTRCNFGIWRSLICASCLSLPTYLNNLSLLPPGLRAKLLPWHMTERIQWKVSSFKECDLQGCFWGTYPCPWLSVSMAVLVLVPPAHCVLPCMALLMVRQLPVERTEEIFSELKAPLPPKTK